MTARRISPKPLRGAVQGALFAGLAAETLRLRRRVAALPALRDAASPSVGNWNVIAARGVQINGAVVESARSHAAALDLAVLDLVPGDLPAGQSLDLLREVDPSSYRADRLAPGRGACHALIADAELVQEAGIEAGAPGTSAAALAAATVQLKLHAPAASDIAVALRLAADPSVTAEGPEIVATWHGAMTELALTPRLARMAALGVAGLLGRRGGAALFALWSAQPLLVFAGSPSLRPPDVARYSATRVVAEPRRVIAALRVAARRRRADDPVEIRRPAYQADLAGGTARFFEPRRDSCPWCASTELRMRLRTSDLFQHKPGEFELDECAGCGHIFQNPRLNADGLRFYYRDFYDGLGEELLSSLFSWCTESYRSRSEALRPFGEPESWLDVGTGHGHFCSVASAAWPQTAFDGLDMADGIELAQRRRWVRRGYRGMFVELAPELSCEYDVVSMFHYLEHTPDPHLELDAARTALRPGGHLLIEVPDPECRWGSLLGRWWLPWFQPQHLHLIPVGNLRRRLEDMGFTIVLEQHAEPNEPVDLLSATLMALGAVAPPDDLPWLAPRTGRVARAARAAVMAGALPALYGAGLADRLIEPVRARAGLTNCYRLLARKC